MVNREPKTDIIGRPVLFYRGKKVCNIFWRETAFDRDALWHMLTLRRCPVMNLQLQMLQNNPQNRTLNDYLLHR